MKRLGWPRPPLILGFVLGGIIERYLFISIGRYDWDWLTQPLVIAFFALALVGLAGPLIRRVRAAGLGRTIRLGQPHVAPGMLLSVAAIGVLVTAIVVSSDWPFSARIVPQVVAYTALACITLSLLFEIVAVESPLAADERQDLSPSAETEIAPRDRLSRSAIFFGWVCGYLGSSIVLGMLPALVAFVLLCTRFWGRESWRRSAALAVCIGIFAWLLFDRFLAVPWPQSLIETWIPALQPYLP
jgi:hypothetical protein